MFNSCVVAPEVKGLGLVLTPPCSGISLSGITFFLLRVWKRPQSWNQISMKLLRVQHAVNVTFSWEKGAQMTSCRQSFQLVLFVLFVFSLKK